MVSRALCALASLSLLLTGLFAPGTAIAQDEAGTAAEARRGREAGIAAAVEQFREGGTERIKRLLARDYVHITPNGTMTTRYTIANGPSYGRVQSVANEQLRIRAFRQVGMASYRQTLRLSNPDGSVTREVMQVFVRQDRNWVLLAGQVASPAGFEGPIVDDGMSPPRNLTEAEEALRSTWEAYLRAVRRTGPNGEPDEDLATIRRILAEDCFFVDSEGNLRSREEVLTRSRPGGVGKLIHEDLNLAVFGSLGVLTSRNQERGSQAMRVFLRRAGQWQMIARKPMSFRPPQAPATR